jgi:hypothetical protein
MNSTPGKPLTPAEQRIFEAFCALERIEHNRTNVPDDCALLRLALTALARRAGFNLPIMAEPERSDTRALKGRKRQTKALAAYASPDRAIRRDD